VSLVLFIYLFIYFYLRSLLILDDVWDPWVLKAFDNQCQILLTTRDKSVTDSVMGKEFLSFFLTWFFETGFLCVSQAGLELRNLPASASQVLGLKSCATTAWRVKSFNLLFNTMGKLLN
jgi:hypothetical protein